MTLATLQKWLISQEGLQQKLTDLRAWSAAKSFGLETLSETPELSETDWPEFLLAASIFAASEEKNFKELALMIAHSAVCFATEEKFRDAGGLILSRLQNLRAIDLAEERKLISSSLETRVGMFEQMLLTRRRSNSVIAFNLEASMFANQFQRNLWDGLNVADWVSATAPTAAGKTFAVLNWVLTQISEKKLNSVVFIAPTRALVSEIERQFNDLKSLHGLKDLKISSLPLRDLGAGGKPFIAVFTQERLHIFLNSLKELHSFDAVIIDEAHKFSDERRGVILQDAVERVVRTNPSTRVIFLSPHSENPEVLLEDAPNAAEVTSIPNNTSTVMQNLVVAEQVPRRTKDWTLSLSANDKLVPIGKFSLFDRPTSVRKRLAFVALALGKESNGTLVYVNTADGAEKVAKLIYDGLLSEEFTEDTELEDLSDFCKRMIHPKFQLVKWVKRGVAFHYGNMPSILREEIERLFSSGKIKFLVSTSTLIEGVNLSCRTIVVRGPKKGLGRDMTPQDFWNLAGRAGRWGADFYGNIVCVDVSKRDVWPEGVPQKTAYPIERETDRVVRQFDRLEDYLKDRSAMKTDKVDGKLEHVAAYLMGWAYREGTILNSAPVRKIGSRQAGSLEELVKLSISEIDIEAAIVEANPGISVTALQRLLDYFRLFEGDPELLLPIPPEDDASVDQFVFIFDVINLTLAPVFAPDKRVLPCALTTWDWMRGKTLGQMIAARVKREFRNGDYEAIDELPYATLIRETMASVEEIARFLAPKYLGAHLSVLRKFFDEKGCLDRFPEDLTYDLYLEFGVSTKTLVSMIGLGLSRTSAIELGDNISRTDLSEDEVLETLKTGEWESLDLPTLVKREIRTIVKRRSEERSRSVEIN